MHRFHILYIHAVVHLQRVLRILKENNGMSNCVNSYQTFDLTIRSDLDLLCLERLLRHECEGGIEKSVQRITDWHQEMTNGNHEGRIFRSLPDTKNVFFFLAHH